VSARLLVSGDFAGIVGKTSAPRFVATPQDDRLLIATLPLHSMTNTTTTTPTTSTIYDNTHLYIQFDH